MVPVAGASIPRLRSARCNIRVCLRGGPMMRGYRGSFGGLSALFRPRLRPLQAAAIALLFVLPSFGGGMAHAMAPSSATAGAHVYLLRGVLNIFSLGLDDLADKLRAQGIPVTVTNLSLIH